MECDDVIISVHVYTYNNNDSKYDDHDNINNDDNNSMLGLIRTSSESKYTSILTPTSDYIQKLSTFLGRRPEIRSQNLSRALVRCARSWFQLPSSLVTSREREIGPCRAKRARLKQHFSQIGEEYLNQLSGLCACPANTIFRLIEPTTIIEPCGIATSRTLQIAKS